MRETLAGCCRRGEVGRAALVDGQASAAANCRGIVDSTNREIADGIQGRIAVGRVGEGDVDARIVTGDRAVLIRIGGECHAVERGVDLGDRALDRNRITPVSAADDRCATAGKRNRATADGELRHHHDIIRIAVVIGVGNTVIGIGDSNARDRKAGVLSSDARTVRFSVGHLGLSQHPEKPFGGQRLRLDLAVADFQIPIAAKIGVACVVIRGGDIGAGGVGQCREGRLILAEVTAINKDVGLVGEGVSYGRKVIRMMAIDAGRVQRGIAKGNLPCVAMG